MRIIIGHPSKKPARLVDLSTDQELVMKTASEMTELLMRENLAKQSKNRAGIALHHAQVSTNPLALFVVLPGVIQSQEQGKYDTIVVNPKIIKKDNRYLVSEGCMSFPHRGDKKIERYLDVVVEYYTTQGEEFVKRQLSATGVVAQVFQHECDHGAGTNIYQK